MERSVASSGQRWAGDLSVRPEWPANNRKRKATDNNGQCNDPTG